MSFSGFGDTSKLRGSKMGAIIGLLLAAVLSILLWVFVYYICFIAMIVAVLMYGIPYYFGFKDRKKLAVFGLVVIIIMGLGLGWSMANAMDNIDSSTVSLDDNLVEGTVTPIKNLENHTYTFSVVLLNSSSYDNVKLTIYNSWGTGGSKDYQMNWTGNDTVNDGKIYTLTMTLEDKGVYVFAYKANNSEDHESTGSAYGPINASSGDISNQYLFAGMYYTFLEIGLMFYMLLFLTWWMDRSKARMQKQLEEAKKRKQEADRAAGTDEKFVCSECGTEVPANADKCPQCGERFDDNEAAPKAAAKDEKKCPKCNAVIFDTDKKCWNCGRELEGKDKN